MTLGGKRPTVGASIASLVVLGVAILTYIRLYFGVDFTDEAFYVAVPYRFVLGARPLIDETNVSQMTAGVLLYPFVKIYEAIAGSAGIVLYARHLHLCFSVGVGLSLFIALRRLVETYALRVLLAALPIAYVPFGIHGLSYDTLGSGLFAAGCFLGLAGWSGGDRRELLAAGIAYGLTIFTYPPLAVPVACALGILAYRARPRPHRALAPALVPAAAGSLALVLFFAQDGPGTARRLFHDASAFGGQGGGFGKAGDAVLSVLRDYPHKYLAAVLILAAIIARPERGWIRVVALAALPLTALPHDRQTPAAANQFITSIGLLAPLVFLTVHRHARARSLLTLVWLPAAVGGVITSVTSSNASINFAIGFFPGAIATAVLIALAMTSAVRFSAQTTVRSLGEISPLIVVLGVCVLLQYAYVYRDAGLSSLNRVVTGGPFEGIRTTAVRKRFIADLDRDLERVSGKSCRILFYDAFPAGYLLGHGRPATNTALLLDLPPDRDVRYDRLLLSYYGQHGGLPDVVVRIKEVPGIEGSVDARSYSSTSPLERVLASSRYRRVADRADYRISTRAGSTCASP